MEEEVVTKEIMEYFVKEEDRKLKKLVDILVEKQVIDPSDAAVVLEMEPFPQT